MFFKDVGVPSILIEKMRETPASDLFIVDTPWLLENNLNRAVTFQPTFLDVVEKSCGVDPYEIAKKRAQRIDDREFKKWLHCLREIKKVNRKNLAGKK